MWSSLAVIAGAAIGGGVLLFAVVLCFYITFFRNLGNKNSDTGSSNPSAQVEGNNNKARKFSLEELEQATKNFSEVNLIGEGSFGLVYKGILRDGTIVVIKRRYGSPKQELIEEVQLLSEVSHRNLVTVIGYCQESGLQMLVSEYVPNGSICSHLYEKDTSTKLEFKQRLSVALGAAKGLYHLHSQMPAFIHRDFKTSNVMVDENFIAKVADAGIVRLLRRIEEAGSSKPYAATVFRDPEIAEFGAPTESGDLYSFGVFLLELVTGREAEQLISSESKESLAHLVKTHMGSDELIDPRLLGGYTSKGVSEFFTLILKCLDKSGRHRPRMGAVVSDLDMILEMEMALTTVSGDGSTTVILGSQLFTSA